MDDLKERLEAIRQSDKFSVENTAFLSRRDDFAAKVGAPDLFSYMDQFGLYAGAQTIASRIAAYEALKQTLDVPGHIMEFGVWHGSNLLFMAKLLKLMRPNTAKQVIGFDNFAGLPDAHELDGAAAATSVGQYHGNEETLRAAIDLHGLEGWVHLVKGDANETIPAYEEAAPEAMVSLAWVDFDLYEPCKTALQFLGRRLSRGGMIVFDEAITAAWPGETIAMREFIEEQSSCRFRMIANPLGRQPVMSLVKE
ncbi:MAG: class I SAM-dependent methyltransferase [Rhodospirillales bacterium]|nr:class I SAM-dependent methyltransferase [Rhodospirillales bacterium]